MNNIFTLKNILIYLLLINLIAFLAMYIDKKRAKWGKWRIKESTLFTLVLLGGGIGGIAGMRVLRHKTKKTRFVIGFPAILIIQIICIIIFFVIK
mgnify:CR=1 FL=1